MNNAEKLAHEMEIALNHIKNANKIGQEMVENGDSSFSLDTTNILIEEFKVMESSATRLMAHIKNKEQK